MNLINVRHYTILVEEIVGKFGGMGIEGEEVTGHFEVLPLVWVTSHFFLIVPGISQAVCFCAEEFYMKFSFLCQNLFLLSVHDIIHAKV